MNLLYHSYLLLPGIIWFCFRSLSGGVSLNVGSVFESLSEPSKETEDHNYIHKAELFIGLMIGRLFVFGGVRG